MHESNSTVQPFDNRPPAGFGKSVPPFAGLSFVNVRRQNECVERVINQICQGIIKPDFTITHMFSLDQAAKAFGLLTGSHDGIMKVMVKMG